MTDYSQMAGLIALLGGFFFVLAVIGIVLWVLYGVGLSTMAKNKGIENGWLAFVPIAGAWILGQVVGEIKVGNYTIDSKTLPLVLVLGQFVGIIPVIGTLFAFLYAVLIFMCYYKLYKMYKPGSEVLYLVLSIVLGFLLPVFIFMLRNETPKVEEVEVL